MQGSVLHTARSSCSRMDPKLLLTKPENSSKQVVLNKLMTSWTVHWLLLEYRVKQISRFCPSPMVLAVTENLVSAAS